MNKRIFVGILVFGILFASTAHAASISDVLKKLDNLQKDVAALKTKLGGMALSSFSGAVGTYDGNVSVISPTGVSSTEPVTNTAVTTNAATSITTTSAQLNGSYNPMVSYSSTVTPNMYFEYGTTSSLGTITNLQSLTSTGSYSETINGLSPNTTYYYRLVFKLYNPASATASGTTRTYGSVISFKTLDNTIQSPLKISLSSDTPQPTTIYPGQTNVDLAHYTIFVDRKVTELIFDANMGGGIKKKITRLSLYDTSTGSLLGSAPVFDLNHFKFVNTGGIFPVTYNPTSVNVAVKADIASDASGNVGIWLNNNPDLRSPLFDINKSNSSGHPLIKKIEGAQSNYAANSSISLNISTTDGTDNPATDTDGYNIQSYIYQASDTSFFSYLPPNPQGSYNGTYDAQKMSWLVGMNAPSVQGSYNLRVVLYCSKENSKCWQDMKANGNYGYENVKILPFTVGNIVKPIVTGCVPDSQTGSYTMSVSPSTPSSGMLSTNQTGMSDFVFAKIKIKGGSKKICINNLQVGALTNPSGKITTVRLYDGVKLLATVPLSDFYQLNNNSSFAAWAPVNIAIPANGVKNITISADIPPSTSVVPGLFNLGFSGINFVSPGAYGMGIAFGNPMAIN